MPKRRKDVCQVAIEAERPHLRAALGKRAPIGIDEKEVNIRNKFSRGKLAAAFLLQCLNATGAHELCIS